jgi:Gas vesicle protein
MTQQWSPASASSMASLPTHREPSNLVDILERVLDKGIVVAGDIRVDLLDIELLTIRLRLLIASVDRAKEMGIDWWEHDPTLSSGARDLAAENRLLKERLAALESGRSARQRSGNGHARAGARPAPRGKKLSP